jgi:hypothetical protein
MQDSKSKGSKTQRPVAESPRMYHCETVEDYAMELNESERTHTHE